MLKSSTLLMTCFAAMTLSGVALADMSLTSTDIAEGQNMEKQQEGIGFGCDGDNLAPSLAWSGAPEGTQSYALTVYDRDAPTGSGLWHWAVVNIPASVTSLSEGAGTPDNPLPEGTVVVRNDLSQNQFAGACPPEGRKHNYVFTVYAMPMPALPLDETASSALVGGMTNMMSLDRASITATYER